MIGTMRASGSTVCRNGSSTSTECSKRCSLGSSLMRVDSLLQMPSCTGTSPRGVMNES